MIERALTIYQTDGLATLVKQSLKWFLSFPRQFYIKYLRHHAPLSDRVEQYNGVAVRPYRVTDQFVPFSLPPNQGGHSYPKEYEAGLINNLRKNVSLGDEVVIIGGGQGATAVIAAQEAGSRGHVIIYEGAGSMITHLAETFSLNKIPSKIDINHAIVSEAKRLDGPESGAPTIPVTELENCDVLELDCEGAEVNILKDLQIRPKLIIVETHGNKQEVSNILSDLGYKIINTELAERGPYKNMCVNMGISVLTAERISK